MGKDFDNAIEKHINFLKNNLEFQNKYASKFSEILQKMDIFHNDENEETQDNNQENEDNNPSNENENEDTSDDKEQSKDEETTAGLDSDYNIEEYKLDEQLVDTDSDQQSSDQVIQKK